MNPISRAAGAWVDRIKINSPTREICDGRAVWIKRRRGFARPILAAANRFFVLAGNPIEALLDPRAWQQWEVDCFHRLHGEMWRAWAVGTHTVAAEELPGQSLSQHLAAGTLAPAQLAAAGRELRRAHKLDSPAFGGPWSHGDPHTGNFIYEPSADRARLIDFEVRHLAALPAEERHADDLLVFLQDLMGRTPAAEWRPQAHAFLSGYDQPAIVARLREKLIAPRGIARIWWAVRTTYLARPELRERLASLRASL